jgi:thiazole synthase
MTTTRTHDDIFGLEPWLRAGRYALRSRLLVGIEQYTDPTLVRAVLEAAGAEVFITTYDQSGSRASLLLSDLDEAVGLDRYVQVGTTSFANSVDSAVQTAHQLRNAFGIDVIKLDVRDGANMPDTEATVTAAKLLLDAGFVLLPLIAPEPGVAQELADLGCAAVRLMGSAVGGYQGITEPDKVRGCIERISVPAIVECGIGSPAHVVQAFELGADAVLVNTLIAGAADPAGMAAALRLAVLSGGLATRSR